MDSYLQIAEAVLKSTRRPMSARAILDVAYQAGVVPSHLHGRTQQKTLQARLSEDILHHRETSSFYRTEPGQFALVEFLNDPKIPEEWKTRFPARRRTRDLKRGDALAVRRSFVDRFKNYVEEFDDFFKSADAEGALAYMHPDEMAKRGYCSAWTFSIAVRHESFLAYRVGRYRDDRDAFANKRSIGFPGALASEDASLFSDDPLGVKDCAVSVLVQDLDLSFATFDNDGAVRPTIDCVVAVETDSDDLDVIIVVTWQCPDWFEPTTRRLSINEPHWLIAAEQYNNIDDFEPWSRRILSRFADLKKRGSVGDADTYRTTGGISSV